MRSCATAGGGVMFIEDTIETKTKADKKPVSYHDLVKEEATEAPSEETLKAAA